jgi:riboflavin biosynthesis pyrimidine reductase
VSTELRFETLYEAPGLRPFDLPDELERVYGLFGLAVDVVYANFVSSVDGVADIPDLDRSSSVIGGGHPSDRFGVALLRACADAVVIGAGTFRAHRGPWVPEAAYPPGKAAFAELRRRLGLAERPPQVVVSTTGRVDASQEKLRDTLVLTTQVGAEALAGVSAPGFEVEVLGDAGSLDAYDVVEALRRRGHRRILTEGGPRLMGDLLQARAVDELFLTVSPVIAGSGASVSRRSLAAGVDLLPRAGVEAGLLSVRRSDSYLFLRYSLGRDGRSG